MSLSSSSSFVLFPLPVRLLCSLLRGSGLPPGPLRPVRRQGGETEETRLGRPKTSPRTGVHHEDELGGGLYSDVISRESESRFRPEHLVQLRKFWKNIRPAGPHCPDLGGQLEVHQGETAVWTNPGPRSLVGPAPPKKNLDQDFTRVVCSGSLTCSGTQNAQSGTRWTWL